MQVRPRHARQLILCFEPGQSHSPPTAQRPEPYGENLEAEDTTHPHGLKLCFNTHANETSLHVRGETNCKHKAYLLAWPSVSTTALAPSGVDPESPQADLNPNQHAVNTQSTYSQHAVNTQSTRSQHAVNTEPNVSRHYCKFHPSLSKATWRWQAELPGLL